MCEIDNYRDWLKENNYSDSTIRTYINVVKTYEKYNFDANIIKELLKERENANTITLHYNVLLAFFRFNKTDKYSFELEKLKSFRLPQKEIKYREVIDYKVLHDKTTISEKDSQLTLTKKMVVRFLFETGLRVSELNSIEEVGENYLKILGKGNKKREVFYNKDTYNYIEKFLKQQPTSKTIRLWVKEILGSEYSPHSLRRSFATHMLTSGASPKMVQQQMGHSKIETTFSYLNLSPQKNKSIYNQFMLDVKKK